MNPLRLFFLLVPAAFFTACTTPPDSAPWSGPDVAGRIASVELNESSGLAISGRQPGLLWSHNDSGGQPVLFALDTTGAHRGAVRVEGVTNIDWEDLAAFTWEGRSWLLIADTGDNQARRVDCSLIVIEEPDPALLDPARELVVPVAWRIPVRYASGGAQDCEAVTVDAGEGAVYLLTKRTRPARLFRLPLHPDPRQPAAAEFLVEVPHVPPPSGPHAALDLPTGRWSGQPVAMDFAPDGSAAAVLTYVSVLLFPREPGETWADALARPPAQVLPFLLPQAEAVCFSADGRHLFVSTEGRQGPLLRFALPETP